MNIHLFKNDVIEITMIWNISSSAAFKFHFPWNLSQEFNFIWLWRILFLPDHFLTFKAKYDKNKIANLSNIKLPGCLFLVFLLFTPGLSWQNSVQLRLDEMFLINACFIITCIDKSDKNNSASGVKITF